jgi:effector-binding domain-containing protein
LKRKFARYLSTHQVPFIASKSKYKGPLLLYKFVNSEAETTINDIFASPLILPEGHYTCIVHPGNYNASENCSFWCLLICNL